MKDVSMYIYLISFAFLKSDQLLVVHILVSYCLPRTGFYLLQKNIVSILFSTLYSAPRTQLT